MKQIILVLCVLSFLSSCIKTEDDTNCASSMIKPTLLKSDVKVTLFSTFSNSIVNPENSTVYRWVAPNNSYFYGATISQITSSNMYGTWHVTAMHNNSCISEPASFNLTMGNPTCVGLDSVYMYPTGYFYMPNYSYYEDTYYQMQFSSGSNNISIRFNTIPTATNYYYTTPYDPASDYISNTDCYITVTCNGITSTVKNGYTVRVIVADSVISVYFCSIPFTNSYYNSTVSGCFTTP